MLGVWAHWKWLAPAMHYTPSPGQPDIMGDVRACVCVWGGGGGVPDTVLSSACMIFRVQNIYMPKVEH